jgi:hypothetical protein
MPWKYERRDQSESGHPTKHRWDKPYADIIEQQNGEIEGKCPCTITVQEAEGLLNTGIEFFPDGWDKSYPLAVYNFHEGVVYKALRTRSGYSYHGFPCCGPHTKGQKKRDMTLDCTPWVRQETRDSWCVAAWAAAQQPRRPG